ncbi:hypothetical protein [Nocardioides perillae]|uniref:Uncharacterized protein n=1 Tax=Nocardioides perillae TaxID=1119534 RepID=A0A7Y9UKI3_9ACTN|nr:hypothetical protein [Nocardioides perillae]NYG53982.1 hypothetical protein [Nocardioides perillae]
MADIRTKVVALGLGSVLVTGAALAGVGAWRTGDFAQQAERDATTMTAQRLDALTQGVYDVVSTQGASTAQMVDTALRTATHVTDQAGGLAVGGGSVTWQAKNQVPGTSRPSRSRGWRSAAPGWARSSTRSRPPRSSTSSRSSPGRPSPSSSA